MTYKLLFNKKAQREWRKLDQSIKEQFKKKLKERLEQPFVPKDKLSGAKDCYKIKLQNIGYRLVYQVSENDITVLVLAVGRRENDQVYRNLMSALDQQHKQKK